MPHGLPVAASHLPDIRQGGVGPARAAMPTTKSAAATPSSAPVPPPAISWSPPRASPLPGRLMSSARTPNVGTGVVRRACPSNLAISARDDSRAELDRTLGSTSAAGAYVHLIFFLDARRCERVLIEYTVDLYEGQTFEKACLRLRQRRPPPSEAGPAHAARHVEALRSGCHSPQLHGEGAHHVVHVRDMRAGDAYMTSR